MTDQEREKPVLYSPAQVAKRLGVSVQSLKYHRVQGNIEGTRIENTNMYMYTEEQIQAADLTHKKPGPKGSKEEKPGEEGPGSSSVARIRISRLEAIGA